MCTTGFIPLYVINAPNLPARGECFLQAAPFDTPRKARHSGRAAKKNISNHAGIKFTSNGFSANLRILILLLTTAKLLIPTDFLLAAEFASGKKIQINSFKKFLDRFHAVQPGFLYRSAQLKPSRLRKYVQKFGIKTVINLRGVNRKTKWWQDEHAIVKELNVNYFNIPFSARVISDKRNIQKLLYLYKFAPKPILIHCLDGIDRSGEAAALWVLEQQGKPKKDTDI
jgi:protein tyrosine phosphatase (PTP) superfamily phosphohydrolase (DUF442 family)